MVGHWQITQFKFFIEQNVASNNQVIVVVMAELSEEVKLSEAGSLTVFFRNFLGHSVVRNITQFDCQKSAQYTAVSIIGG